MHLTSKCRNEPSGRSLRALSPFSLYSSVIITAIQPDDVCTARDPGQAAVLMFLDLSAALVRSGQHVLLNHPPVSLVDSCVSTGFGPSSEKSYETFSL